MKLAEQILFNFLPQVAYEGALACLYIPYCIRYTDSIHVLPLLSKSKFRAPSHLLCLYSSVCGSVCVEPVRKPHCLFSTDAAHMKT